MTRENSIWIGIDVGSITCKVLAMDEAGACLSATYRRTNGRVVEAVKDGLEEIAELLENRPVAGCGTTGSGRQLVGALVGADVVKNEITAHTRAALALHPDTRTILEIGGEDSKIVILRDGVPVDFAMNAVCAAGTGAFLDQLAGRLGIAVTELGDLAMASAHEVAIAGRCTVFAESDIIFKQQTGHRREDIVAGACRALVRNYLNDVGKGKTIEPPVLLLGGVATNRGIREAFVDALDLPIEVPELHNVMGAYGAALLARAEGLGRSGMRPLDAIRDSDFRSETFGCTHCPNACEVVRFVEAGRTIGFLGGRCERWESRVRDGESSATAPASGQEDRRAGCSGGRPCGSGLFGHRGDL